MYSQFFLLGRLRLPKPPVFVRELRPQAPNAFGLNRPSQLILGYHWLAFLNQVWNNLSSPQFKPLNTIVL